MGLDVAMVWGEEMLQKRKVARLAPQQSTYQRHNGRARTDKRSNAHETI
jgi:hypothetical protein